MKYPGHLGTSFFPEFDSEVTGRTEILGSAVYGLDSFFIDSVGRHVDKVLRCQGYLRTRKLECTYHRVV